MIICSFKNNPMNQQREKKRTNKIIARVQNWPETTILTYQILVNVRVMVTFA